MAKPLVYRWRDTLADAEELTTMQRAAGWRCSDYADATGGSIRPGSVRLARDLGLTVREGDTENRVVLKALRVLVERGFLEKVRDGYRGQAAEYRLTFPSERWSVEATFQRETTPKGGLWSAEKVVCRNQPPTQDHARAASAGIEESPR